MVGLSLWDNGEGNRLGGIRLRTNRDREYFPFVKEDWRMAEAEESVIPVGAGVVLGVWGKGGWDVDALGVLMLRENTPHFGEFESAGPA